MPIDPAKICDCLRCGYGWIKRVAGRPARCPKCKQPNWDIAVGTLKIGRPLKAKRKATKK